MGGRSFVPQSQWSPELVARKAKIMERHARYRGYDSRKAQLTAYVCTAFESVVAFLAFVFIFGTLAVAGCGLVYVIVGGALNILGVEVPGISSR